MKALYWLRTDLRLLDNSALVECLKNNDDIVFVFAHSKSFKKANSFRKKFIDESIASIQSGLKKQGFTVIESESSFLECLPTLLKSHFFDSIYFTQEYAWDEKQEEVHVREFCRNNELKVFSFDQGTLIAEKDLPFSLERMPFIFTDFRKKVEYQLQIKPQVPSPFAISSIDSKELFDGGESAGLARLNHYLWKSHSIESYKQTRNGLILFDDSSKFSPWLNAGCLSPRTIYHEVKKYEKEVCENDSTYWLFFELLWRDYFKFFSLKFGRKIFSKRGLGQGSSPNRDILEDFLIWSEGKTQDPFVNANMNELNQTGWMSNRGRQNVASYLIHDLGLNWTWGATYFEEKLLDYDPDSNWGNWLYLSGRGSDPRARKFNTVKQAGTYDPLGEYQQLWRSLP